MQEEDDESAINKRSNRRNRQVSFYKMCRPNAPMYTSKFAALRPVNSEKREQLFASANEKYSKKLSLIMMFKRSPPSFKGQGKFSRTAFGIHKKLETNLVVDLKERRETGKETPENRGGSV